MTSKVAASRMTILSTSVALERRFGRDAFAQQPQIPEAHPPPGRQRKETGQRDKAKAAHLNEEEQHCLPENVNCVQVSRTTRPVTQVALVAVNRASTSPSRPCLLAMGRLSSSVPAAITSRKLTQMVWVALLPASQPFCLRRLNFSFFVLA